MSESTSETQSEQSDRVVPVAEKRKVLQDAGVPVGARGKLSAENEAKYRELTAQA